MKYIIKRKDGETLPIILTQEFSSKEKAYKAIFDYACDTTKCQKNPIQLMSSYEVFENNAIDVNLRIDNFDEAKKVLGNDMLYTSTTIDEINSLVDNINPKGIRALDALNELLTIAQAWNKEDNFVPDFRKQFQLKWFPCFKYYDSPVYIMYSGVNYYTNNAPNVYIGQRFCFKTAKRAEQFGKQFRHLFREVFMS